MGWRYQNTEDSLPSNDHSDIFHMDATFWRDDLNKTSCNKEENAFYGKIRTWPKGERFLFSTLSDFHSLKWLVTPFFFFIGHFFY